MAKYYNTSIAKDVQRIFNFKMADNLGSDVGSMIVPVIQITRTIDVIRNGGDNTSGTLSIFATPSNKDFYLTAFFFRATQDAASDNTGTHIDVPIDTVSRRLANFRKTTLTADTSQVFISFPVPIKLDRGSSIDLVNSFTVGNATKEATIYGYFVETTSV